MTAASIWRTPLPNSRCGIKHKIQLSRLDPETLAVVEDGPIVFDGTLTQPTAEGPKTVQAGRLVLYLYPGGRRGIRLADRAAQPQRSWPV